MVACILLGPTGCGVMTRAGSELRESNFAVEFDLNQLVLPTAEVRDAAGRLILGSAHSGILLSADYARRIGLSSRDRSVPIRIGQSAVFRARPEQVELGASIDAILGAEVLGPVISIDFRRRLVTATRGGSLIAEDMQTYPFREIPTLQVNVNGQTIPAIVDTTIPDTLILPSRFAPALPAGRHPVDVALAGRSWQDIDVLVADVETARIGNRLLHHFLIVIDYPRRQVALWPYE